MTTGADHDPFFDDSLWGIPDGSSAGTGFGWGEGLAAESSLRDLSTRLFSAAFSRARSGAPSPPIENPSEPRFEAPLYDIFAGGARSLDLDGGARSLNVALDHFNHVFAGLHTWPVGAQSTGSAVAALRVRAADEDGNDDDDEEEEQQDDQRDKRATQRAQRRAARGGGGG